MAVPAFHELMLPFLKLAGDREEHTVTAAMDALAAKLKLSSDEQNDMLPSGTQTRLRNRVQWAVYFLFRARLIERVTRGKYKITERGIDVLRQPPHVITPEFLNQFAEFREFSGKDRSADGSDHLLSTPESEGAAAYTTPDERLDTAYKELRATLADDLLDRVRASKPSFFEQLVLDVLKKMGYGGSHADAARVVGRSGDGGIDGVIPEDRLGLDMVYVQAKKWENSVGPDEIRKFVGSLGEQKAHKGVFITSGSYTSGAKTAAEKANARVVLIDGKQLAELMIDHGVGVADSNKYVIKKLDIDYFEGL